jgi:hypothetical protein
MWLDSGRMRSLTGGVCTKLLTKLRHNQRLHRLDRPLPCHRLQPTDWSQISKGCSRPVPLHGWISPSLDDCHAVPNSRWQWGSVALPLCGQACARSRRGGVGSGRGCRRRPWRRKRPHPQAGGRLGMGPQLAERININSASSLCGGGRRCLFFASHTSPSG